MNIDNLSLQSLGKFNRGVGVTDLRDALEGRSSMSNPALVAPRPASLKTFDRSNSVNRGSIHNALSVRSGGPRRIASATTKPKKVPGAPGEVKDALDRLGIGSPKVNGSTLKASLKSPSNKSGSPYGFDVLPTRFQTAADQRFFSFQDTGFTATLAGRTSHWVGTVAVIAMREHTVAFQTEGDVLRYSSQ